MRWWQLKERGDDLARELESDLELEEEEQRENGLPPGEAHYTARRALGNTILIKERTHEAWGWATFEHLAQDFRFALRQLVRNKRFTAILHSHTGARNRRADHDLQHHLRCTDRSVSVSRCDEDGASAPLRQKS